MIYFNWTSLYHTLYSYIKQQSKLHNRHLCFIININSGIIYIIIFLCHRELAFVYILKYNSGMYFLKLF